MIYSPDALSWLKQMLRTGSVVREGESFSARIIIVQKSEESNNRQL
jgi:hypothetical protein